jgi:two-component system, NtrC family, sensor kinase
MEKNLRILIIDDDPGVRESYEAILSPKEHEDVVSMGQALFGSSPEKSRSSETIRFDLVTTERGDQGIQAVERSLTEHLPFAVAFVDMKMPGMDGAEVSKRIWDMDPGIKIIIVTAYSEYTPEDIIRVTGRDDIFYLRKPFNPEEIRQFARTLTHTWNLEREGKTLSEKLQLTNRKLADMNENLHKKVEEQANILIQTEKMASIGLLAAGVAHEINNPISYINGNLTVLKTYADQMRDLLMAVQDLTREESLADERIQRAVIEKILRIKERSQIEFILEDLKSLVDDSLEGVDRVCKIVRDLRTFSRIDEAEFKPVKINEALDTTLNIIWSEIKAHATVEKRYGEVPLVHCFPQKISQVLMNLLVNAAQAIEGNGKIVITTRYEKVGRRAGDERVLITITDTGKGIAKPLMQKIFDPFFTTKPVGKGTGLGLSISYDIVKAHGGRILVQSQEGKGSQFTVILPVHGMKSARSTDPLKSGIDDLSTDMKALPI